MPLRPRTPLHDLIDRLFVAAIVLYIGFFATLAGAPLLSDAALGRQYDPREHPEWMVVLFGVLFATSIARTWLRGDIFPADPPGNLWFCEGNASGRSYRSVLTRLYGADRGLEVTVYDDELWTRFAWWHRWLLSAADFGLENRIPLRSITAVKGRGRRWWRRYNIEYRDASGATQRLMLKVRNTEAFLAGLRHGNPDMVITDD